MLSVKMEKKQADWQKQMKEILQNEITPLNKKIVDLEAQFKKFPPIQPTVAPPAPSPKKEKHATLEDQIGCKDCYPKILNAVIAKEFKGAEAECTTCGLPVHAEKAKSETWNCPGCDSKSAKLRK